MKDFLSLKRKLGRSESRWVTVFGTSDVTDTASVEQAEELGRALAKAGHIVVTGGYGAAMEGASRGAQAAGGYTVGVTLSFFSRKPNAFLSHVIQAHSLLERLDTLIRLGDGYVAGKGGTGTLAEIAVAWEYINKRIIPRRPLVLVGGFWDPLPRLMMEAGAAPGVSIGRAGDSILTAGDVPTALSLLASGFPEAEKDQTPGLGL